MANLSPLRPVSSSVLSYELVALQKTWKNILLSLIRLYLSIQSVHASLEQSAVPVVTSYCITQ